MFEASNKKLAVNVTEIVRYTSELLPFASKSSLVMACN